MKIYNAAGRVAPPVSAANPGKGQSVRAGFANAERSWEESVDLLDCLERMLKSLGQMPARHDGWLELDGGLVLQPQFVSLQPLEPSGVQTCSTIQVHHEQFPAEGFFEFQHSTGDGLVDSFGKGFKAWADLDLPVILDALRANPRDCTVMQLSIPWDGVPGGQLHRRAVLGPATHYAKNPAPAEAGDHPFCPCCLLTNSFEAFRPLLESPSFHAVRLFAMRNAAGDAEADCRVNGEDFQPGHDALVRYVASWPDRGVEFRKQFVILQTAPQAEP